METERQTSDDRLIRRVSDGDEEAFAAIYSACGGPVYRFARQMTGDAHLAEEITQDTFLQLLSKPRAFQAARGSLLAWLLGIARNLSRRALGAMNETEVLDESSECEASLEDEFIGEFSRRELVTSVRQAIASLPPTAREVVILCELQELNYREAAVVLDCPVGTVRSRLHRARALLLAKLQARCPA